MTRNPLVSILLPVRNGQSFIRESIKSIVVQSFENWELIIIDNGSTDDTKEVCRSFQDKRIVMTDNPGSTTIAHALNWGLDLAKGSLIARLDADDIAKPQRLERQVEFLENNLEVGIVGTWMELFGDRRLMWKYPVTNLEIQLNMFFSSPFGHPSVMYRKDWQEGSVGYYDPAFDLAEDYELWTRISRQWKCWNIPEPLTLYRAHSSQSTKEHAEARKKCVSRIRVGHCKYWGIPPLDNDSSFSALLAHLSEMKSTLESKPHFAGGDFRQLKRSQVRLLIRRQLVAVFDRLGALNFAVKARFLLENWARRR